MKVIPIIKNIVHINTNDVRGGAAIVPMRLAQSQRNLGMNSNLLVGLKESNLSYSFPFKIKKNIKKQDWYHNLGMLDYEFEGSHELIDNRIVKNAEILHLHNLHGGYFNIQSIPELTKTKPVIWTLHDMQAITGHCAYSFDCEKWLVGCGNCPYLNSYPKIAHDSTATLYQDKQRIYNDSLIKIITPSKWLYNKAKSGIFKNHDIEVIYNGVDIDKFKPINSDLLRDKYNINKNTIVIGSVANGGSFSDKRKGGDYINQIIDRLTELDKDFIFVNIGSNHNLNKDRRIIDVGYINNEEELANLYNLFDIFLFPSLADNCPLVILEALATGLPIIAFNTGGIPELVVHNHNGFIVKNNNVNESIEFLLYLIDNKEVREKFAKNSRLDAVKKYDHNKIVMQYQNAYERIKGKFSSKENVIVPINNNFNSNIHFPKVIILYKTTNEDYKKEETYKCIKMQTYLNIELIIVDNFYDIDLNNYDGELVYCLENGPKIKSRFLETMVYEYNCRKDKLIWSTFTLEKKDGSSFFKQASNKLDFCDVVGGYKLKTKVLFNLLISKSYFIENKRNLLMRDEVSTDENNEYQTELISMDIEKYLVNRISDSARNIYIYGAGSHTRELLKNINFSIDGIIVRKYENIGKSIEGISIISIEEIEKLKIKIDYIIISSVSYEKEIYEYLCNLDIVDKNRILKIYE